MLQRGKRRSVVGTSTPMPKIDGVSVCSGGRWRHPDGEASCVPDGCCDSPMGARNFPARVSVVSSSRGSDSATSSFRFASTDRAAASTSSTSASPRVEPSGSSTAKGSTPRRQTGGHSRTFCSMRNGGRTGSGASRSGVSLVVAGAISPPPSHFGRASRPSVFRFRGDEAAGGRPDHVILSTAREVVRNVVCVPPHHVICAPPGRTGAGRGGQGRGGAGRIWRGEWGVGTVGASQRPPVIGVLALDRSVCRKAEDLRR